jgi:hypothetical protein
VQAGRTAFLLAAGEGHCPILDYLLSINRMQLGSRTVVSNFCGLLGLAVSFRGLAVDD